MNLLRWYSKAWCIVLAAVVINSVSIAADVPQLDVIADTVADGAAGETKPAIESVAVEAESKPVKVIGEEGRPPEAVKEIPTGIADKLEPVEVKPVGAAEEIKPEEGKSVAVEAESEPVKVIGEEGRPPEAVKEIPTGIADKLEPVEDKPNAIEPIYVRALRKIEPGHNDSNPSWSPTGEMIAFERGEKDKKELIITRLDGSIVQKIYYQLSEKTDDDMSFFLPGNCEEVSYNSGVTWSPAGDLFVFMSNGGGGNYDLYICELESKTTIRLTEHDGKDGHAAWSPVADDLVFVSGRTGKAEIYLMSFANKAPPPIKKKGFFNKVMSVANEVTNKIRDKITDKATDKAAEKPIDKATEKATNKTTTRLTHGEKSYLYPQWSPDGKEIVMLYGSNENHDIYLIGDVTKPAETLKALTTWDYDDLRPIWSPDGKKIAFYSNYNPGNDRKIWSIIVISSDGSDPVEGKGLAAKVVASDVVPDLDRGPAWMPDSARIIYAKNDGREYNPIYIVDLDEKTNLLLKTDTKMNHDITCSVGGAIAFRAQVEQWDHIYVVVLEN